MTLRSKLRDKTQTLCDDLASLSLGTSTARFPFTDQGRVTTGFPAIPLRLVLGEPEPIETLFSHLRAPKAFVTGPFIAWKLSALPLVLPPVDK